MSNDYVTTLLVEDRLAQLRHEADQERLARLARVGQPRRRWWERLMLSRKPRQPRPAPRFAAGNSTC